MAVGRFSVNCLLTTSRTDLVFSLSWFFARWIEYQNSGNNVALTRKKALFFRSTFAPSLASPLTRVRGGDREAFRTFADRLEGGLTRHLVSHPVRADILFQTITLAKSG